MSPITVGIAGASGFGGADLLRLLAAHPVFQVGVATADTKAGTRIADLHPHLAAAYPDQIFVATEVEALAECEMVFCAMPHGASQTVVPRLLDTAKWIVDLGADFRLKDPALYPRWYGEEHTAPELLAEAVYGLPELNREALTGARLVALPGCYPTAAALAIAPLVRGGLIEPEGVVVNAATGVSGAGRPPKEHTTFCAVDETVTAYGLLTHRHTPEIEQASGANSVLFTPHLVPMNRGILATVTARPAREGLTSAAVLNAMAELYDSEPFIVVDERSPSTKDALGANTAHLTARVDPRTGLVLALCAIDNLTKGTAGQAIQCANLVAGLPETTALPTVGLAP